MPDRRPHRATRPTVPDPAALVRRFCLICSQRRPCALDDHDRMERDLDDARTAFIAVNKPGHPSRIDALDRLIGAFSAIRPYLNRGTRLPAPVVRA